MTTYETAAAEESTRPASAFAGVEGLAGIAAVVLTILGLAQVAPLFLVAIATLAVGIALAAHGAGVAALYVRLIAGQQTAPMFIGGSVWSIEFLAGISGVILGILALLQIEPAILVAIAAIAYGAGVTLGSSVGAQLTVLSNAGGPNDPLRRVITESASSASAVQALAGLAAIVLGILSLSGFVPVTLILIGLLTLGGFTVVNGALFGGAMVSLFRR